MASHYRSRPAVLHRRPPSLRATLSFLVVGAAMVMGISNVALRAAQSGATNSLVSALPSVVLASNGQSANRVALNASGLSSAKDVVVPVDVTNAGNETLSGVVATLASQSPGVQLAVDTIGDPSDFPVAPGATIQYKVRLHVTGALAQHLNQVVVAFSPASSVPTPAA